MGTPAVIRFIRRKKGGEEVCLVCVVQLYDGYISHRGLELAKWLSKFREFGTIEVRLTQEQRAALLKMSSHEEIAQIEQPMGIVARGVDDLAAQYIAMFKKTAGGLYIENESSARYEYYVIEDEENDEIKVAVEFDDYESPDLSIADFLSYCQGVSDREQKGMEDAETSSRLVRKRNDDDTSEEEPQPKKNKV